MTSKFVIIFYVFIWVLVMGLIVLSSRNQRPRTPTGIADTGLSIRLNGDPSRVPDSLRYCVDHDCYVVRPLTRPAPTATGDVK